MRIQTSHKVKLFARALRMSILGVFALLAAASLAPLLRVSPVAAAVSSTINFQARLETNAGAIVPDGNYNVEFKLYNTSVVTGTPDQGACTYNGGTADSACLWVETRTGANQVRVVNGYLTVSLGSVNSFGSSINWNQQLWLTMRIGGTSGTPSWDAEMSPRIQLTAVPYSFQAGTLATTDGSGHTGTLAFPTTLSNATDAITLPDATGTVCLQNAVTCGFAVGSGTAFLQGGNSFSAQAVLGTNDSNSLAVRTAGTNRLIVDTSGNLQLQQASTFNIASNTNGAQLTIQGGAATSGTNVGGNLLLQGGAGASTGASGSVIVKSNTNNSTTAFQVQNASSSTILNADTANMRLGVDVTYASMTVPSGLACPATCPGTGGSLTAGTYIYEVTAIDSVGGETTASNEVTVTTSGSNLTAGLTWNTVTGASGYKVYRTAAGGASGSEKYLTTVTTSSYSDSGVIVLGTATPPASNTAYVSTPVSNNSLQLSVGGNGTPTGQLYVSGTLPATTAGIITDPAGSGAYGLYVRGNYVYAAEVGSNTLGIYDVSNPASPTSVSSVAAGNQPNNVFVLGRYAYVTEYGSNSLQIFDVSNPASPTSVSSVAAGNQPNNVFVLGRYAYVTEYGSNSLQIFDVSNPASPTSVSSVAAGTGPWGIYVQGRYAYVGEFGSSTFQIFDVSNPASPTSVSSVAAGTGSRGVYVQGRYAYIAERGSNSLQIFDVSNPASPTSVSSTGAGSALNVYVQGRYAYVTNYTGNTFQVFDVSNPASPTSLGTVATGSNPDSMYVQGRYAYVANLNSGTIGIYDLGGAYIQQLQVGGAELGTLTVNSNSFIYGNESIQGGLTVGQSTELTGNVAAAGQVLFQNNSNSATAFQVQNTGSASLFTVNTSTTQVAIGQGSLVELGLGVPTGLGTVAGSNQGGSFSGVAGTTYYYEVSAINSVGETYPSSETSFASTSFTPLTTPGAPTSFTPNGTGGSLGSGVYKYEVTFQTANGETTGGTSTNVTTTTATSSVAISGIPTGPTGTTGRKIYRTAVNGSTYKLVTAIADNTTTTYTDTLADGSLGATVPGSNTATTNTNNISLSWTAVVGATSYRIYRGTSSGGEGVYFTSATNSYTDTGSAGSAGTVVTSDATARIGVGTSSPSANLDVLGTSTLQTPVNTTTALQVQNSSGNTLFDVDTTNSAVKILQPTGSTIVSASAPGTVINDGLINSYSGTLLNNATFISGSYVQLNNGAGQNGQIEYTPSLSDFDATWQFYTSGGADANYMYAFCTSTPTTDGAAAGGYAISYDEYRQQIYLYFNGTTLVTVNQTISSGVWHNAEVVRSGTTIKIYMDSSLITTYVDQSRSLVGSKFGLGGWSGGIGAVHAVRSLKVTTGSSTVIINGNVTLTGNTSQSGNVSQTGQLFVTPAAANQVAQMIQGASSQSADLLELMNSGSSVLARFAASGNLYTPSVDNQTAATLTIGSTNATAVSIGSTTSNIATTVNGTFVAKPTASHDSTVAFQVQNASGYSLLTGDTTNTRILIGQGNLDVIGLGVPSGVGVAAGSNQGGSLLGASSTTYYYRVSAINSVGETLPSSEVSIAGSGFTALTSPGAATLALTTGTNLGIGLYKYEVTFTTANGETTGGTSASITTTSGNQAVNLTAIPTGPTGTTGRNIYRTVVGGSGSYELLTTIADNTTTTYSDTKADGSLGAVAPVSNTATTNTNNASITWAAVTGATSYRIYRGTSSGGESAYFTSATNSYTDTGSAGTAGSPTASDATARLGIGTSSPSANLQVLGTSTFKTSVNTTTGFQLQNSSGSNLLTGDTTNMRVGVDITYSSMPAPAGLAVGAATAGGSLSGTYKYEVTALDSAGGETTASNEATGSTSGSNDTLPLTWTAVAGASAYKIYRTTAGGSSGSEAYLTTVLGNSYSDAGTITLGTATPPGSTTAYTSTNASNNNLQLSVGGTGTPTGQLYVSGGLTNKLLSSWPTDTTVQYGFFVSGRYVYTDGYGGPLDIWDASNPLSPTELSSTAITPSGSKEDGLWVAGHYAYITSYDANALYIYDVSNPKSPSLTGSVTITSGPWQIYVQGRYAYVTTYSDNTLHIIDVTNPAAPYQVGSVGVGGSGNDYVDVQGSYAYVSSSGDVLSIVNVSNPASPTLSGSISTLGSARGVYVQGRYAYISTGGYLEIYDISNPASPSRTATIATPSSGQADAVSVQGRYAYVGLDGGGVAIYDISNPAEPVFLSTITTTASQTYVLYVQGRYLYTDNRGGSFNIFDIGGAYIQQLQSGAEDTSTLQVDHNATIAGDGTVQGGLYVGQNAEISGNIGVSGQVLLQNISNSTSAFQVQNASGVKILTVDTTNLQVKIGAGSTGEATPALLVVDSETGSSGDPTEVDGAIYYNATLRAFRCGQNGVWRSCGGNLVATSTAASSAISNTVTETDFSGGTNNSYAMLANDCQPGVVYMVNASGVYSNALAASTLTFTLTLDGTGTALVASGALPTVSSAANAGWRVNAQITCDTTGTSGTVEVQGQAIVSASSGPAGTSVVSGIMANNGTVTVNTTTSHTLGLAVTWGAASSSNTITMRQFTVQRLGP